MMKSMFMTKVVMIMIVRRDELTKITVDDITYCYVARVIENRRG